MKAPTGSVLRAVGILLSLYISWPGNAYGDILVDAFETPQDTPGDVDTRNTADGNDILGGERDFLSFTLLSANGIVPHQLYVAHPAHPTFQGPYGGNVAYDGNDNDPSGSGGLVSLGLLDLTQGDANDRFRLGITAARGTPVTLIVEVAALGLSSLQVDLPTTPGPVDLPFASFIKEPFASNAADFHSVGWIQFSFITEPGESVTVDDIVVTAPEPASAAVIIQLLFAESVYARRKRLVRGRTGDCS